MPVARLIDADRYDGSNPGVTANPVDPRAPVSAGMAEIANANFYSENTLRGGYPSPTDQGLIRVNLDTPLGRVRRYFSRPAGLGLLPANPLRAECASEAYGGEPPPYPCMDGVVWNQVAAHMLPRAVGYASGVLDYFFRGATAVTGVEWTPSGITLTGPNDGAEEMEGIFEVHARHQPGSPVERRTRLASRRRGTGAARPGRGMVVRPCRFHPTSCLRPPTCLCSKDALASRRRPSLARCSRCRTSRCARPATSPTWSRHAGGSHRRRASALSCGDTATVDSESMRCEWRVVNHRVSGVLETNTWIDPGDRPPRTGDRAHRG